MKKLMLALSTALMLLTACENPIPDVSRVETQIRNVLTLHTYEHIYRDIVYFGEEKRFLFLTPVDRRVLFAIDIVVRAGVDLSEGFELLPDRRNDRRVFVRLPASTVLTVDADETSIEQYFLRDKGGAIGWLELGDQLVSIKERIASDAVKRGILSRADENARRIVSGMLRTAGFEEVVVETVSRTPQEVQG